MSGIMLMALVGCSLLSGHVLLQNVQLRGQLRSLDKDARARDHVITDLIDCVVDYADHSTD